MISTKFKKGDTIYFMADNKPMTKEVTGVSIYDGYINELHVEHREEQGLTVMYHCGDYEKINEKEVFASEIELKESLFPSGK